MVNKCCVVDCKSRYMKKAVKVHRFPLKNKTTLPSWIAITGKEKSWKPTHSSRLCCNHFIEFDYKQEHKKGVLKPTSVPSIEYKDVFLKYRKNTTKLQKKKNNQEKIEPNNSSNCHDDDDKYGNNHNEIMQYENSSVLTKYLIEGHEPIILTHSATTNFENLPYSRNNSTSINNYMGNIKPVIVISPTECHNGSFVNTMEQITNSIFNKIMALKLKKPIRTQTIYSLYFKSPRIRRILSQDESLNSLNYTDDTDIDNSRTIFCNSIG